MVEQSLPQKIYYGAGNALKELGPKAWEARVEKVIDEKILPKASPKIKEWIESHKGTIAKAGGWVATGAEVAVVAGAAYGGIRLIKKGRLKYIPKGSDLGQHAPNPTAIAESKLKRPLLDEGLLVGSAAWFAREAKRAAESPETISPELLSLGESARWEKNRWGRLQRKIARHTGGPNASEAVAWKRTRRPLETVAPEEVPDWLRQLATPEPPPQFIQTMMERRAKARASEAAAVPIDTNNAQAWWKERKGWESKRPPSIKAAAPVPDTDLPPFLRQRFSEGPPKRSTAPQQTAPSEMLFAPSVRAEVISVPGEKKPAKVGVRKRIGDILRKPNEVKQTIQARLAAGRAQKEARRATQEADRQAQQAEWDRQAQAMRDKRDREADLDQQTRLEAAKLRALQEQKRLAREAPVIRRANTIDPVLAQRSPELVAAIAGKVATLPTNESTNAKELAGYLVHTQDMKENKKFVRLIDSLRQAHNAGNTTAELSAAASLLEAAHNTQPKVKKITGPYGMTATKFTTLAAFWQQRLGLVGFSELVT